MKFHVCKYNGMHTEGNNPNFALAVMDSEPAVVIQEQDIGVAIVAFVKTSAQLSVVVKNRTEC